MPHQLIQTEDGSITLYVPELNEHYHSVHGAIQESIHIFIRAGLDFYLTSPEHRPPTEVPLSILEAGFGTGLNAYLSGAKNSSSRSIITVWKNIRYRPKK